VIRDSGDSITLANWYKGLGFGGFRPCKIEKVSFADGTVWDAQILEQKAAQAAIESTITRGTAGGDILTNSTFGESNTYIGGRGDDVLEDTRGGSDTSSTPTLVTTSSATTTLRRATWIASFLPPVLRRNR
jgi:hypothetical protein